MVHPAGDLIIIGTSHAVNLTDGLDSLAGWNLTLPFAAYGVMTFLDQRLTEPDGVQLHTRRPCAAFLWYNAHPARSSWAIWARSRWGRCWR